MTANLSSVPSPCVGVCHIDDASGLCDGCQRTLAEITDWASLPDRDRLATWARINERRLDATAAGEATQAPVDLSRGLPRTTSD